MNDGIFYRVLGKHEKYSGRPVFQQRFEPGIFWLEVQSVTSTSASPVNFPSELHTQQEICQIQISLET